MIKFWIKVINASYGKGQAELRGLAGKKLKSMIKFLQLHMAFNFIYTEYFIKICHSFILVGV